STNNLRAAFLIFERLSGLRLVRLGSLEFAVALLMAGDFRDARPFRQPRRPRCSLWSHACSRDPRPPGQKATSGKQGKPDPLSVLDRRRSFTKAEENQSLNVPGPARLITC